MSGNYIVQPALVSDIDDVLDIANECRLSPWSADAYEGEIFRDGSIFYCAREGARVAGFVLGRLVPCSAKAEVFDAEILNIGVSRAFRRNGVGGLLINNFIKVCLSRSVDAIWLEVRASNEAAINFYGKHGFLIKHRRKTFYSAPLEDALVMTRKLSVLQPTIS